MQASILILCWNHERYISQCLESIFAQTSKDIEILFLDNVSTDNSYDVAKGILEKSGFHYQLYKNDAPQPVTKNFNFLFDKASGEFIFPFSADDWMAPENIEEKVNLLKSKPQVGIVFGGGWLYYDDLNKYEEADMRNFKRGKMVTHLLIDRASYFHPGPAYKKVIVDELGKWDENLLIEDLDLNIRIAKKYEVDFVPKPLIYYRRHSTSFLNNYKLMLQGFEQYYNKYKQDKSLPMDRWMSDNFRNFSFEALDKKDYSLSLQFLYKSIQLYPSIHSVNGVGGLIKRYFSKVDFLRKVWFAGKKAFAAKA